MSKIDQIKRSSLRGLMVAASALVLCAALAGCATKSEARRAEPDPDPATTPVEADCSSGFTQALRAAESFEPDQRVKPVLTGLEFACPEVLAELGEAAGQAKSLDRHGRATLLAQAATEALPPACSTTDPLSPAASMVWSCPPQDKLELAEPLLQDLDAGTYLFMLAVRARLANADKLDEDAKKLLDTLVMAAALEGETAALNGSAAGNTPPL